MGFEEPTMTASNACLRMSPSQSGHIGNQRSVRRVLIIDDHPIVREGLRGILDGEDDLTVCGEAETAREARIAIKKLNPHLVITEFSLKQGDGIDLVREVRAHHPQWPILVLTSHAQAFYAERIPAAGANGYIMNQAASEQFLGSLRHVLDGHIYVSEAVGNNMIHKFAAGGPRKSATPIDRLSNRELQILHMIGKGMSTRVFLKTLRLPINTLEPYPTLFK